MEAEGEEEEGSTRPVSVINPLASLKEGRKTRRGRGRERRGGEEKDDRREEERRVSSLRETAIGVEWERWNDRMRAVPVTISEEPRRSSY